MIRGLAVVYCMLASAFVAAAQNPLDVFRRAGIVVVSSGNCHNRNNPKCTSLDGMKPEVIQGAIELRKLYDRTLYVTGGTEVGHASGTYSHANGYKIDYSIRRNPGLAELIASTFAYVGQRKNGDKLYSSGNGFTYAIETHVKFPHIDVQYVPHQRRGI